MVIMVLMFIMVEMVIMVELVIIVGMDNMVVLVVMTFELDFPGNLCRAAFAILAMFFLFLYSLTIRHPVTLPLMGLPALDHFTTVIAKNQSKFKRAKAWRAL